MIRAYVTSRYLGVCVCKNKTFWRKIIQVGSFHTRWAEVITLFINSDIWPTKLPIFYMQILLHLKHLKSSAIIKTTFLLQLTRIDCKQQNMRITMYSFIINWLSTWTWFLPVALIRKTYIAFLILKNLKINFPYSFYISFWFLIKPQYVICWIVVSITQASAISIPVYLLLIKWNNMRSPDKLASDTCTEYTRQGLLPLQEFGLAGFTVSVLFF